MLTPYSVEVNWDQTSDATGYLISYNSTASNGSELVKGGSTTTHTLTNLEQKTQYTITVEATGSDDRMSAKSDEKFLTTFADGKK